MAVFQRCPEVTSGPFWAVIMGNSEVLKVGVEVTAGLFNKVVDDMTRIGLVAAVTCGGLFSASASRESAPRHARGECALRELAN